MADDIEEFLKRVAEKRRGQQSGRAPANQPKPQPAPPQQRPPQQRQPAPPQQRPVAPPPVVQRAPLGDNSNAPTVDSSIHQLSTDDVQKHAQQYMSRSEFDERAKQVGLHAKPLSHLESSVARVHTTRAAENKAGGIQDAAAYPGDHKATVGGDSSLEALLRSPEAFRSAYLLSLVLDKPAWKDFD